MLAHLTRFAKALILTALFAVLLTPSVSLFMKTHDAPAIDEKRKLAQPPVWPASPIGIHAAVSQGQKWFADHFAWRAFLIRAKTQIDFSLFHTSDRVHVGGYGFLFYRSVMDEERYQVDHLVGKRMDDIVLGTTALRDDLARSGRHLIVVISPTKNRIYPEYVPTSAPREPEPLQIVAMTERLRTALGPDLIEPMEALRALKSTYPVYFRTDAHWNGVAGYTAGHALIDRMAAIEGVPSPWRHPLEVTARRYSGGEATFLPLFDPPSEMAVYVTTSWANLPDIVVDPVRPPYEYAHHVQNPEGLLPCVTVVGDSFFDAIQQSGMTAYVADYRRARWHFFPAFSDVVSTSIDCKYLVFHFVEGGAKAINTLADYQKP